MKKIKKIINDYIEDFLIFLGLLIISITTLVINKIIGLYVIGIIFIILGALFALNPKGR